MGIRARGGKRFQAHCVSGGQRNGRRLYAVNMRDRVVSPSETVFEPVLRYYRTIPTGEPLLDALADGNLLKGSGPEVYVMEGGKKRHITSRDSFTACSYGWDAVYVISDSRLSGIPTGASISGPPCPYLSPPTGSLIQGSGDPVYVMQDGLKRHVPSREAFSDCGYLWGNINLIPDSSLASIPMGDDLTGESCP